MQLGNADYVKVIPLFYLQLFLEPPITIPSHHQVVLPYTTLVVQNPLILPLLEALQEAYTNHPQEELEDPLMLVPLVEVVHLEVEESLMGIVPLHPLIVVHP